MKSLLSERFKSLVFLAGSEENDKSSITPDLYHAVEMVVVASGSLTLGTNDIAGPGAENPGTNMQILWFKSQPYAQVLASVARSGYLSRRDEDQIRSSHLSTPHGQACLHKNILLHLLADPEISQESLD